MFTTNHNEAPHDVVAIFKERMEELRSDGAIDEPWVTAFYARNGSKYTGGLWLPEKGWHYAIGDRSYVHYSLVMASQFALGGMGIECEGTPEYSRMKIDSQSPQVALASLVGTMKSMREQVEHDFGVTIKPLY